MDNRIRAKISNNSGADPSGYDPAIRQLGMAGQSELPVSELWVIHMFSNLMGIESPIDGCCRALSRMRT